MRAVSPAHIPVPLIYQFGDAMDFDDYELSEHDRAAPLDDQDFE